MKKLNYAFNQGFQKSAIALTLVASFLTACGTGTETTTTTEEPATAPQAQVEQPVERAEQLNVRIGELTGNVEDYVGQRVSVRGDAERTIGETAFLLRDDQLFGGKEVVVINATGSPFRVPTNEQPTEQVQVTGEVRQLVLADVQREYNLNLDPNLYAEYENRPVIIAQSIALAPDPEEVSENPQPYYNREIAVSGQIGENLGANTFTLQEQQLFGGEEVLVIGATPNQSLENGEEVVITGVLRPYVAADFERDYDLTWDLELRRKIEAEYTQRPVLVADQVYPSAE